MRDCSQPQREIEGGQRLCHPAGDPQTAPPVQAGAPPAPSANSLPTDKGAEPSGPAPRRPAPAPAPHGPAGPCAPPTGRGPYRAPAQSPLVPPPPPRVPAVTCPQWVVLALGLCRPARIRPLPWAEGSASLLHTLPRARPPQPLWEGRLGLFRIVRDPGTWGCRLRRSSGPCPAQDTSTQHPGARTRPHGASPTPRPFPFPGVALFLTRSGSTQRPVALPWGPSAGLRALAGLTGGKLRGRGARLVLTGSGAARAARGGPRRCARR